MKPLGACREDEQMLYEYKMSQQEVLDEIAQHELDLHLSGEQKPQELNESEEF